MCVTVTKPADGLCSASAAGKLCMLAEHSASIMYKNSSVAKDMVGHQDLI